MQPENSRSNVPGIEQLPLPPSEGQETIPVLPPLQNGIERGQVQFEQAAEAGAQTADATRVASSVATPTLPLVQPVTDPVQSSQPTTLSSPLVAADEDLIEKEWVDKAKDIIEHTRDDPHSRTKQVNELQRDYLQKRYGKIVGSSD